MKAEPPTTRADLHWPAVREVNVPAKGDLHVWSVRLDCDSDHLERYRSTLSEGERRRAKRLGTETLRQRYIVSQGVLRTILGKCIGAAPEQIRFNAAPKGKPALASPAGASVEFNLSHSANLMLLAIASRVPVGVDVESVRSKPHALAIARRFFSGREADWLEARPDEDRERAFFWLWTKKEAVLKTTGDGLRGGLASFEVLTDEPSAPFEVALMKEGRTQRLRVMNLEPAREFVGAVACPLADLQLQLRTWPH